MLTIVGFGLLMGLFDDREKYGISPSLSFKGLTSNFFNFVVLFSLSLVAT